MSKRKKRLERLRQHPHHVRFEELHSVLLDYDFECRQPKSGSSHYVYVRGDVQLTVPFKRPFLKSPYIREALRHIDSIVTSLPDEEEAEDEQS